MKVDLKISVSSQVVAMSFCPRDNQGSCGIQYRSA